jgi:hypothetical protein
MSRKKKCVCGVSMLIFAGFLPVATVADPVDVSNLDTAALRALFHSPNFSTVCPLEVYGEDYSNTEERRSAALHHIQADKDTTRRVSSNVREVLRSRDLVPSDGVDHF